MDKKAFFLMGQEEIVGCGPFPRRDDRSHSNQKKREKVESNPTFLETEKLNPTQPNLPDLARD